MLEDIFFKKSMEVVENLLEILEVEIEELTCKGKELIAAYSFGFIISMSEEDKILNEIVYQDFKKILIGILKYDNEEAKYLFKRIVESIKETGDKEFHIMIYQGKFTYLDYKNKNYNEVYNNLTNMIDVIVSKKYESY